MSRGRREGVPMRAFHAEVVHAVDLSPSMRRVVFGGPGLTEFRSTGICDEYVRLLFPEDPWTRPELPGVIDGDLDYGSIDLLRLRTYTVRDWDAGTGRLTIDFVVHPGGVAAGWALQAEPGQVVGVNSPTGLYDPPPTISWQVLVADLAGLPAAHVQINQTLHHFGHAFGGYSPQRLAVVGRIVIPLAAQNQVEVGHAIVFDGPAGPVEANFGHHMLAAGVEAAANFDADIFDGLIVLPPFDCQALAQLPGQAARAGDAQFAGIGARAGGDVNNGLRAGAVEIEVFEGLIQGRQISFVYPA